MHAFRAPLGRWAVGGVAALTVIAAAACGAPGPGGGGAGARYAALYRPNGTADVTAGQPLGIELGDMYFQPNTVITVRGVPVELRMHNGSPIEHNFSLQEFGLSQQVGPGQTATVRFVPPTAGTYYFYCAVPGHASAGMVGKMTVQ